MAGCVKSLLRFVRNYLWSSEARYCYHRSLFSTRLLEDADTPQGVRRHIDAAIEWILHAQSLHTDGGVTKGIGFAGRKRVLPSYPEVTGYIITTMMAYHDLCGEGRILDAANRMVDFELPLQMESGAFPAGVVGDRPRESVFNSAQIVNGLLSAYRKTGHKDALNASVRACDWIVSVQEADGSWAIHNYKGIKRTYDTKVSESLLDLYRITKDVVLYRAAERNLEWVLSNQTGNGWFCNCDNSEENNDAPLNHTLGYTIQGLIECFRMSGNENLLRAARKASDPQISFYRGYDGLIPGRFDSLWRPVTDAADVSGAAQLSICWQDLSKITGEECYRDAAFKVNKYLRAIQFLGGAPDIRGAVPCSYPFWSRPVPYGVTSWAVKYFVDALISEYYLRMERTLE